MKYSIFFFLIVGMIACSTEEVEPSIEDFIAENNLTGYESTPEGLYYKIDESGSDLKPRIGDSIYVHYRGYYPDGEVFDTSYDRDPFLTNLNGVIVGWRIGIPKYGEGGSGTLIVPPSLAYGQNPTNGIRANSLLLFDIEVLKVIR